MKTAPALLPLLLAPLCACAEADLDQGPWEPVDARALALSGSCSGVKVPDTTGFAARVALTFDDGPNPATTPLVLDTLAQHGIRATFLINGTRVSSSAAEAMLDRIVNEGHLLGNHTQQHKNSIKIPLEAFRGQVDQTTTEIEEALSRSAPDKVPRFFRFPFGSSNCDTMKVVQVEKGYIATGWHIDSADWCFAQGSGGYCSPQTFQHVPDGYRSDMPGLTLAQVKKHNGGIVLFHDIHKHTALSLDGILRQLEDAGFSFVLVDDAGTFPKLNSPE